MKQLEAAAKAAEDSRAEATSVQEALSSEARRAQASSDAGPEPWSSTLHPDPLLAAVRHPADPSCTLSLGLGLLNAHADCCSLDSWSARRRQHDWC